MKEIVIISGKGGTGKTILTASFASLAKNKVMADCDVDAADLHLLLRPDIKKRYEFKSGRTAVIDKSLCTLCGECIKVCRFNAINKNFSIDNISCEGCGICNFICPSKAIKMEDNLSGEWYISSTKYGPMVHARLGVAEENSGKLVNLVRQKAKEIAEKENKEYVIIDGPPGIGCPVISSISGVDCAIVVTEPSLSAVHDAQRIIKVTQHFDIPVKVIINKFDLNLDLTGKITDYCKQNNIEILGRINYDEDVIKSLVEEKIAVEYSKGKIRGIIEKIWSNLQNTLAEEK